MVQRAVVGGMIGGGPGGTTPIMGSAPMDGYGLAAAPASPLIGSAPMGARILRRGGGLIGKGPLGAVPPNDPLWEFVVGLWNFNGSYNDLSPRANHFNILPNNWEGVATVAPGFTKDATGKFKGLVAGNFDGATNQFWSPDASVIAINALDDITVEAYINPTAVGEASGSAIVNCTAVTVPNGLLFNYDSTSKLGLGQADVGFYLNAASALTLNAMSHVAWSRGSGVSNLWMNGTSVANTTGDTHNFIPKSDGGAPAGFAIGGCSFAGAFHTGTIAAVRITRFNRYRVPFTPDFKFFPSN